MDCSTPGFPVLHHLPGLAQTLVHRAGDAVQHAKAGAIRLTFHLGFVSPPPPPDCQLLGWGCCLCRRCCVPAHTQGQGAGALTKAWLRSGGRALSPGLFLLIRQGGPGLTSHPCDARGFCPLGLRSQRPELRTPLCAEILMGLAHRTSVLSLFPPWTRQRENNLSFSTAWKLPRTNRGRGKPLQGGPDTRFPAAVSRETQMNRDAVSRPSLVGTGGGDPGSSLRPQPPARS